MSLKLDFSNIKESLFITKEEILSKISEIDIIEFYLNIKLKYNTCIKSPFRESNSENFSFKIYPDYSVLAKDWVSGVNYDCFNIVQKLYNCNFTESLRIIASDFNIKYDNNYNKSEKSIFVNNTKDELNTKFLIDKQKTIITIQNQAFTISDISYWEQYSISLSTLVKFDVFSCKYVWLNGNLIKSYSNNNPTYAYRFTKYKQFSYKIYSPMNNNKKYKWLFNGTKEDIEGFDQLPLFGELLIITKSLKDVMVLHELGFYSISLQGEGNKLENDVYENISKRFSKIIVLYDNDSAGINGSNLLSKKYELQQIFIPKESDCKDISDYMLLFGKEKSKELISNLIS